jgi:hypothetical protein
MSRELIDVRTPRAGSKLLPPSQPCKRDKLRARHARLR